jgi:hypothetical protein
MATSSDSNVIDRQSNKLGLADRYLTDKAGGAFNARTDVKTEGSNVISIGGSSFDVNYTATKGFKINMQSGQSELKDVSANGSNQLSRLINGFNNKRYSDGSFSR